MTERFYKNYNVVRDFVNNGSVPTAKEAVLAIADILHNHRDHQLVIQATSYAPDFGRLGESRVDWKERRALLQSQNELVREVIRRLLYPHRSRIKQEEILKLKASGSSF